MKYRLKNLSQLFDFGMSSITILIMFINLTNAKSWSNLCNTSLQHHATSLVDVRPTVYVYRCRAKFMTCEIDDYRGSAHAYAMRMIVFDNNNTYVCFMFCLKFFLD